MLKKIIEDKRILSLYIIVIFVLILGVTYALGTYTQAFNVTTGLIAVDDSAYGETSFDTSEIDFKPILDTEVETNTENVIKIDFTVGGASTNNNENIIYDIALADLALDCELLSPYIKWKLVKDGTELTSGTLEKGIVARRLVLTEDQIELPAYSTEQTGYHSYTFYMWFSDSCQNSTLTSCFDKIDQSDLVGKRFYGKVEVELYTESKVGYGAIENRAASDTSACVSVNPYLDFDIESNTLPNAPNLDNNNLIPVYYDESGTYTYTETDGETETEVTVTGVWKKADSTNTNNSWYDYSNKMWANAVVISEDATTDYANADTNTVIIDSDIVAFYVWIPRFKYKVWNITRQGGNVDTYSYDAYSYGIKISFEEGTSSTGNVECNYNVSNATPATTLSDQCYYNNSTDEVLTTDSNKDYYKAWYTHPAFTFGGEEKTGFWIGKFETSGTVDETTSAVEEPKILPDVVPLTNQNVSTHFATAQKFQSYFTNLDAHMLTNLEWGAVAYLTYSINGVCDVIDDVPYCTGVNHNNSSSLYTGRSGGALANSDNLTLTNTYGSGGANKYNTTGYYNYKGYKLDSTTGEATPTKIIDKVASTTRNVTGVYDMSGGAWDYVMGNQVNASYAFQPANSGFTTLDAKYYNAYSYGTTYMGATEFNRARLGDATAEVLGGVGQYNAWNISTVSAYSRFLYNNYSWFIRGGHATDNYSGLFAFSNLRGEASTTFTFRSSLS